MNYGNFYTTMSCFEYIIKNWGDKIFGRKPKKPSLYKELIDIDST